MKKIKYWIKATRPYTLIASVAPILIVSALCNKYYTFNIMVFVFTLLAALLIQIMTNFINDLYDFKKGADNESRNGPARMIQKGYLSEKEITVGIYIVFLSAFLIGVFLVTIGGYPILLIGLSAFLFAYLYTATKFSIAYNGLGEIFVFLYFGIIATLGASYLQTSQYIYEALILGIISGSLNVALLVINNLRDVDSDAQSNKNTLVVIFGKNFGKIELLIAMLLPFFAVCYLSKLIELKLISFDIFVLILFCIFIIFKIFTNKSFLRNKALPILCLYIFLFTGSLIFKI